MKKTLIILLLLLTTGSFAQNLYPGLHDQSEGITEGYGAWGPYEYSREETVSVDDKGAVTVYLPQMPVQERPAVIFINGWGQEYTSYDKFLKYIVSLGYPVIDIYNTDPGDIVQSYQNSLDMIQQAVADYAGWIDTDKIALMGHSYGGGATIWLGSRLFDPAGLNWGTQGRFIMMFAPWLSFLVEDTDLQNYPGGVKLLMLQSYDDFYSTGTSMYNTDPRALRAVYQLINIPDTDKDFVNIYSDDDPGHTFVYNGEEYTYLANHYLCYTGVYGGDGHFQTYDRMDVYAMNRLAHAMADYVFEGNQEAANVALGNGSPEQTAMDILPVLEVTDYYVTTRPEEVFAYKCSENQPGTWGSPDIWKLQNYCTDADGDGHIDNLTGIPGSTGEQLLIFPNPAGGILQISTGMELSGTVKIRISDTAGKVLVSDTFLSNGGNFILSLENLKAGVYFVSLQYEGGMLNRKFVKR